MPSQSIKAEHVIRPTSKCGEGPNHTWTKLTLPKLLGTGKQSTHVYLTNKAEIMNGRLLADARFTRDKLGKWSCVVHRTAIKPRPLQPLAERIPVFLDPGSRTGQTAYCPSSGVTTSYMEGQGGVARVMDIAFKIDALIREQKAQPEREAHRHFINASNKQKHRLHARVKNLVRDAHRRVARDLTAQYDTIVLPVFETKRMTKKPLKKTDPRRKLNSKAARALITLSHYKFRQYLTHRCLVDGCELHTPGEEYTTKACPYCGECKNVGSSKTFTCTTCRFTADRDEKAAFTYAVKCLHLKT